MPLIINTNVQSMNSQRQLVKSGMEQSKAMERLSSGQRINSAADDAAGLVIANRMTSQVRGLDRAVANANDGISMIKVAEGAMSETTNILQRMRELAIQSSNGIYTDADRATLDAEVQQLVSELNRISDSTSFNGQKLLDGSLSTVQLQVGATAGEQVSFSIKEMSADKLGLGSTSTDLSGDRLTSAATIADGDILINGQNIGAFSGTTNNANLDTLIENINTNVSGVTATGFNVVEGTTVGTGVTSSSATLTIGLVATDGGATTTYTIQDTNSMSELVDAINAKTAGAVTAGLNDNGQLVLSNSTGAAMTIGGTATVATAVGIGAATYQGSLGLSSDDGSAVTVTLGANGSASDLAALGFNSISDAGVVTSSSLDDTAQNGALVAGDLLINGVDVGAVDANAGLAAKVDAINAISDETGVTASMVSEISFSADLSQSVSTSNQMVFTAAASTDFAINGTTIALLLTDDAAAAATKINAKTSDTGVTATANPDGTVTFTSTSSFVTLNGDDNFALASTAVVHGSQDADTELGANGGSIILNGYEIENLDLDTLSNTIAEINTKTSSTGVTASLDDNGSLKLSSSSMITIQQGSENGLATAIALGIDFSTGTDTNSDGNKNQLIINPSIRLNSANDAPISIEVTTNGAADTGFKNLNTELNSSVTGSALSSLSIKTQSGAQSALESIDNALDTINNNRAELGAISNRLDFTVSNLMNISENTAAARSRIMDADFAMETAALSRAQVLQQAASAMLAQANAMPAQVLSLLR